MQVDKTRKDGGASRRAGWLLGLLLAIPTLAAAERLPIKTYDTTDGLGSDFIENIVADSTGFLWFCTRDGLSRFDGHGFVTYRMEHGLPNPTINDLLQTREGEYWVATNGGGVCLFHPDPGDRRRSLFTVYPVGDSTPTSRVNVLHQDRDGRIWAGTDAGLFRLEETTTGRSFRRVELDFPPEPHTWGIEAFAEDREGNLWIGSGWGLWRRSADEQIVHYPVRPTRDRDWVPALLVDREGRLWMGHETGLAQLVSPGDAAEVRWHTPADGLADELVVGLHETADGRIWIATGRGLTEFDGQRFRSYSSSHGLHKDSLIGFAEDRDGNLWINSFSSGAMKLALDGFVTFDEDDGLGKPEVLPVVRARTSQTTRVHSVFESRAGELLVVSGHWFVNRFDGTASGFSSVQPGVAEDAALRWGTQAGFLDRSGQWWMLTNKGLYRFAPPATLERLGAEAPLAIYTRRDGLPGDWPSRLFEDRRGDIWVGTYDQAGLARWDRATEKFQLFSPADGLPDGNPATAFSQDQSGALWVGFRDGGLARRTGDRFVLFTGDEGLPDGGIQDLHLDAAGRLWIASTQGGLARLDEPAAGHPSFVRYTTADGLSSNNVRSLTDDRWGRIYVGTARGVDRLDPNTGSILHYTTDEGLANNFVGVGFRDSQDRLWFGTQSGLSRLVPQAVRPPSPSPAWIGGLQIAGVAHPLSELGETEVAGAVLAPRENHLRIDFFGLSFASGEALQFQYKLEGADDDWSPPTEQRSVTFASMAPGRYRFLVRAVSGDRVSPTPAGFSFTVLPPVWRRWWFLTLAALAAVLLAYVAIRYRVAHLLELERVRTRIATDLHDDIGSSLSQIAILSEVAHRNVDRKDSGLTESLSRIAGTSRELVDSMSDIVWAINPKRDRLSDVVRRMRRFASDTLTAADIDFSFRAPADGLSLKLGANTKRQLFLIFKEAVNNAVRHSGCKRMEIELRMGGDRLSLTVRDDGSGFDPSQEAAGQGLQSMRARAQELGGELTLDSGTGRGTVVVLKASRRFPPVRVGRHDTRKRTLKE